MFWTEVRGVIALAVVVAAISIAWTRIENSGDTTVIAVTTTSTTTTTVPVTTTTTPEELVQEICDRAQTFSDAAELLASDGGNGPVAVLALDFWTDVLAVVTPATSTEIIAVVNYYENYIEIAGPFDYSTAKVILEGDKERLQQLITRPAPGLATSRGLIAFICRIDVADQPRMSTTAFDELEDRLLDPRDPREPRDPG